MIFSIIVNFEASGYAAASELTNEIGAELARVCGATVHVSDPAEVMPLVKDSDFGWVDDDDEC